MESLFVYFMYNNNTKKTLMTGFVFQGHILQWIIFE